MTAVETEQRDDFVCEACDLTFASQELLAEHNCEQHGAPRKKSIGEQALLD
jgi:hypothetical protein